MPLESELSGSSAKAGKVIALGKGQCLNFLMGNNHSLDKSSKPR